MVREALCEGDVRGRCTCEGTNKRYCYRGPQPVNGVSPDTELTPVEVSSGAEVCKDDLARRRWLCRTARRVPCGSCGRLYFLLALCVNHLGHRVCPTCLQS